MHLKKGEWFLFIVNLLFIIGFTIYYWNIANYEFIIYIGVIVLFFVLILATWNKTKFDYWILGGLTLWAIMHLCGGGLKLPNGSVLYTLNIVNLVDTQKVVITGAGNCIEAIKIFKFDQLVHFIGFGVTALITWHLLKPYLNNKTNYKVVYAIIILTAMGLGALNEIVEFSAVVAVPETGVGGYFNTALDLVFNTLGAIVAIFIIHVRRKREEN
ncbi:MAG: DUF2238 domain-containing protein [Candidatus Pacearchaeota archaeon]